MANDDSILDPQAPIKLLTIVEDVSTSHAKPPTSLSSNPILMAFEEAVLPNHVFLQSLIAQEILHTKFVSRSWAAWFKDNVVTIAHARRHVESRDWYFPLYGEMWYNLNTPMLEMSGMWHARGEFLSESKLRNLPPMGHLPPLCICNPKPNEVPDYVMVDFLASSEGLLLFEAEISKWLPGVRAFPNNHSNECRNLNWNRSSLIVTNPLTKLFKELPRFDGASPHMRYSSPLYYIMVDDIANTYKVLIFWCTRKLPVEAELAIYDSRSSNWQPVHHIRPLLEHSLESSKNPPSLKAHYTYAGACTRGRLYLADFREGVVRVDHINAASIRLFEVDIETGQWKLCIEFPLGRVHNPPLQPINPISLPGIFHNLDLVECMGQLYAVIPARLDEYLYHTDRFQPNFWENVDNSKYMPLQFHIFQLEGDVGAHGVLRIEALSNAFRARMEEMYKMAVSVTSMRPRANFSCTAKGSVIWVSVVDYLLQFDVLSGECKTEVLPYKPGESKVGLAYRANFHMKP